MFVCNQKMTKQYVIITFLLAGWSGREHKYGKYKKSLTMVMLICIKKQATFEVQFLKKLSNTEAEFKRSVAYIIRSVYLTES